jgi:hypothetical protein
MASMETRVAHHSQPCQQDCVEQERLAAFEINRVDGFDPFDLLQQLAKLAEREGTLALWSALPETVVALARALVGDQDVDSSQHDLASL